MSNQASSIETAATDVLRERDSWPLSPCVLICTLDDADRCLGCGRTLQQISGWAGMSKAEQWSVVDALADWESDSDSSATGA